VYKISAKSVSNVQSFRVLPLLLGCSANHFARPPQQTAFHTVKAETTSPTMTSADFRPHKNSKKIQKQAQEKNE